MTAAEHPTIFTVGHSNHTMEAFIALLSKHRVNVVVDIRSAPYSSYAHHFNREAIRDALDQDGIDYVHLGGGMLGGRPTDRSLYDDAGGRVRYDKIAETEELQESIGDLIRRADECRIALMCAEKDPLDCHRALLVSPALVEHKIKVEHILADGNLDDHDDAMGRLVESFTLPLFDPPSRDEAISLQAKKVGHVFEDALTEEERWSSSS